MMAAKYVELNWDDVTQFSVGVLRIWKTSSSGYAKWSKASMIDLAMSLNSASCESEFSLFESMYGPSNKKMCLITCKPLGCRYDAAL